MDAPANKLAHKEPRHAPGKGAFGKSPAGPHRQNRRRTVSGEAYFENYAVNEGNQAGFMNESAQTGTQANADHTTCLISFFSQSFLCFNGNDVVRRIFAMLVGNCIGNSEIDEHGACDDLGAYRAGDRTERFTPV